MPYIHVKVSNKLGEETLTALKSALGQAITAIPGKSEAYLMVCIEEEARLWFAGENNRPMAFVDVRILGRAKPEDYSRMTGVLCDQLEKLAGIAPTDVYVTYAEVENWGWNRKNF